MVMIDQRGGGTLAALRRARVRDFYATATLVAIGASCRVPVFVIRILIRGKTWELALYRAV